jgi:glycosyltransferase involved in cell wall biosynthesis
MPMRVALIIPALDEEASIAATLAELRGLPLAQVIVVDNGSRDRTAEVARDAGAEVLREPRRGYGQACLAGIAALGDEINVVAFLDADGNSDPADLPTVLAPIERGEAEMVIGSRALGTVEPGALPAQQRFGNWLAARLLRACFGIPATDLGPLRAVGRDALARLRMQDKNYGWTIEMQIKAHRAGLRVAEVPVRARHRHAGESKVSGTVVGTFRAGWKILWTIAKYRLGGD